MADPAAVTAFLEAARKAGTVDLRPCALVSDAFQPIDPHRVGIAHLIGRSRFLLGDPCGLGKTPQTLAAFGYIREQQPDVRGIVLASKSAQLQWADEVERFLPSLSVEVVGFLRRPGRKPERLSPSQRRHQWERLASGKTAILISTYHTLALDWRMPTGDPDNPYLWAFPPAWAPFILVLDECHHLRSGKQTLLYPAIKTLQAAAKAVWGLTATPLSNRLTDLWFVFSIVAPGLLGPLAEFERTYLNRRLDTIRVRGGASRKVWKVLPGGRNLPHLADVMRPYVLKRPTEVIGKHMPDLMVLPRTVEMGPEQTALYEQVLAQRFPRTTSGESRTATRRQAVEAAQDAAQGAPVGGTNITAEIAALGYAQMALDCPAVLGHPEIPSAKFEEVLDLLTGELASEKVLVYSRYSQVAEFLVAYLKKSKIACEAITGDVSATKRNDLRLRFTAPSGDLRVIALTSAGSESLNLQSASVIISLDLPWTWSEVTQLLGRARRFGSTHAQVRWVLLGANTNNDNETIDNKTLKLLQAKALLVRTTFGLSVAEAQVADAQFTTDYEAGSLVHDLFADVVDEAAGQVEEAEAQV